MAGTSYTRQSTISDGGIITASLFNNEFNQLLNAFAYASSGTTGHSHDGSAGQGAAISKIGDQDFKNKIEVNDSINRWDFYVENGSGVSTLTMRLTETALTGATNNTVSLGAQAVKFSNVYATNGDFETLNVSDDAAFVGTTAANKITFDKSLNSLHFADDMALAFGQLSASPGDLRIYHDGSNSYIKELGTGNLFIQGDTNINIGSNSASSSLQVSSAGTVFRGNNSLVSTLTSTGMQFEDDKIISVGNDGDLQIYHDSNNSYIKDVGTGNLNILASTDVFIGTTNSSMANFNATGAVDLYYNNSKKFETSSAGASITGTATASTGLTVGDATSSLQLTHDGNNSYIKHVHSAGTLRVPTRSFAVRNAADSKTLIRAVEGGEAELYHDGQKKIETTDTGVYVTGAAVAAYKLGAGLKDYGDGNGSVPLVPVKPLHVYHAENDVLARIESGDTGAGLSLVDSTTSAVIRADNGVLKLMADFSNQAAGSHIELHVDGSQVTEVTTTGLNVTGTINATTAVDTPSIEVTNLKSRDGTSAGSIADSTGIVTINNGLELPNDKIIKLGDTGAMEIFHNGQNSIIREQGPGALSLRGNEVTIKNYAGTKTLAYFTQDAAAEFFYNNVKTLETVDGGAAVTGTLSAGITTISGAGAASTDPTLIVDRTGVVDGAILSLRADGTANANFFSTGGNRVIFCDNTNKGIKFTPSSVHPRTSTNGALNNTIDLGLSSSKFRNVYANGIIFDEVQGQASSNTLGDYEEGTWTPTYIAVTNSPSVTYDSGTGGHYTKVGRLVTLTGRIRTDAVDNSPGGTDAAGGLRISGLPFAVSSNVTELQNGTLHCGQIKTFTSGRFPAGGYAIRGSSEIALTRRGSSSGNMVNLDAYNTGGSNFTLASGTNSNEIVFSVVYYTDE